MDQWNFECPIDHIWSFQEHYEIDKKKIVSIV